MFLGPSDEGKVVRMILSGLPVISKEQNQKKDNAREGEATRSH
jgi:hypothetical protein